MPEEPRKQKFTRARRREIKKTFIRNSKKLTKKDILTNLVWMQANYLSPKQKRVVLLYAQAEHFEHLPNGTPYAIVYDFDVSVTGGKTVSGLNKPVILVSSNLDAKERQTVAQHEYLEWALGRTKDIGSNSDSHNYAVAQEDPRIRDGILQKLRQKLNRERAVLRERHLRVMSRNKGEFRRIFKKISSSKHTTEVLSLENHNFIVKYNREKGYFDIHMALNRETATKLRVELGQVPGSYVHLGRFNYP